MGKLILILHLLKVLKQIERYCDYLSFHLKTVNKQNGWRRRCSPGSRVERLGHQVQLVHEDGSRQRGDGHLRRHWRHRPLQEDDQEELKEWTEWLRLLVNRSGEGQETLNLQFHNDEQKLGRMEEPTNINYEI